MIVNKYVKIFALSAIFLAFIAGCATVDFDLRPTPQRTYYEAQNAYINAWDSYHKVWLALPDTDPRKAQWVQKYHPKFLFAAELLSKWSTGGFPPSEIDAALNSLEDILIQLAIQKGGK